MLKLIISDIDGTLFNNEHRVDFIPADKSNTANWHEFNARHIYDEPIQYRIQLLNLMAMMPNHGVVYLTSRTETFADSTKAQLNMNKCPPGALVMRGANDNRRSAEFKVHAIGCELAARHIDDSQFALIDDDHFVCAAVAHEYPNAHIIKVPSQCCAYLAASRAL